MKASELIEELQKCIDSVGDIDVVVYANHGQTQMCCEGADVSLVEFPDDGDGSRRVIEIYGDGYYE